MLLVWTATVSALGADRWDNLKALVLDVTVAYGADAAQLAVIEAYYPWRAFDNNEDLANMVARTAIAGLDPRDAAAAVAGRRPRSFLSRPGPADEPYEGAVCAAVSS